MAFDFNATTNKNYLQTINPNAPDAGAALKVLSLNLPNFLGGSPIAPDALLRPGLSANAMVGGTPSAPSPSAAPPPVAGPSDALAGLAAQLGSPTPATDAGGGAPLASTPAPSSPTAATASSLPTTAAPIASLASSALSTNNFAPPSAPPPPNIQFDLPGGGLAPVPTAPAPPTTDVSDQLAQLLNALFQSSGPDLPQNDTQAI